MRLPLFSLRFRLRWCALGLSLLALECSAPRLGVVQQATGDDFAYADEPESLRWLNGLSTQALVLNAVLTNAATNRALVANPLTSASLSLEPLNTALLDPFGRATVNKIVHCALPEHRAVQWISPDGETFTWYGKYGLWPSWGGPTGSCSIDCQQWISPCLLALNNGVLAAGEFGRHVMVDARSSAGPGVLPSLRSSVTTDYIPRFAPNDGPIESLFACPSPTTGDRDCGWAPFEGSVGTCMQGETIWIGAGAHEFGLCTRPVYGSSDGETMIRICDQRTGPCNSGTAIAWGAGDGCPGTMGAHAFFTCPSSGFFAVMVGSLVSDAGARVRTVVARPTASPVTYPAPASMVFPLREGGWFGNFHAPEGMPPFDVFVDEFRRVMVRLNFDPYVGQIVARENFRMSDYPQLADRPAVFSKVYGCASPGWTSAAAYESKRICALAGTNCAAEPLGYCFTPGPPCTTATAPCCLITDAGIRDFQLCLDRSGTPWPTITTLVNHKADLVCEDEQDSVCDYDPFRDPPQH